MFIAQSHILPLLCLASLVATKLVSQLGWLDRLVAYHKNNFLQDLARLPTPLTVTVEKAPPGFVDSPDWDKESVLRLIMLVEVLDARPARQAIRRALSPSRRIYLPGGINIFDIMPDWSKNAANDYEYNDMMKLPDLPGSYMDKTPLLKNDTIVYISNPVEAHLPSSRVTIKLLREIMEARAVGLREMPTTERSTFSWGKKGNATTHHDHHSSETTTVAGHHGGSENTTVAGNTTETTAETTTESKPAPAP